MSEQLPKRLFGPADVGAIHGVSAAAVRKALAEEEAMPKPVTIGGAFVWLAVDLPAIAAVMKRRAGRRKRTY